MHKSPTSKLRDGLTDITEREYIHFLFRRFCEKKM